MTRPSQSIRDEVTEYGKVAAHSNISAALCNTFRAIADAIDSLHAKLEHPTEPIPAPKITMASSEGMGGVGQPWRYFQYPGDNTAICRVKDTGTDEVFEGGEWKLPEKLRHCGSEHWIRWNVGTFVHNGWTELAPAQAAELIGYDAVPEAKPTVGTEHFPTPAGFERTGEVRCPKKGDYFIGEFTKAVVKAERDYLDGRPNEILRKLPEPPKSEPVRTIEQMAREAAEEVVKFGPDPQKIPNICLWFRDKFGDGLWQDDDGSRGAVIIRKYVANAVASVAADAIRELVRRAEAKSKTHLASYKPFVTPDELRSIAADMGVEVKA